MFGNYIIFGPRGSNPLSYHGGQVYISRNNLESPCPRMRPAIASSVKFLPCILKKMKCEYFLQFIPYDHPPPPPAHEGANGVTVGTLKHG